MPSGGPNPSHSSSVVASVDNKGWSLYGAPWLQPMAISGKSNRRGNGKNKPKPLPSVATSCRLERMVGGGRRFESVRGLQLSPCSGIAVVFGPDADWFAQCPPSVHQRPRRVEGVEE